MTAALIVACLSGPPADSPVARGRYLVHHVAMCVQCHSPRNAAGDLIPDRLLTGAPMPVSPPAGRDDWGLTAPHLAGLPGWEPEAIETLLVTGRLPNGFAPDAPMPPFRLSREDANAVVAYLKSLD